MHKAVLLSVLLTFPAAVNAQEMSRGDKFLATANPDTTVVIESVLEYIPDLCAVSRDEYLQKVRQEVKARTYTKSIKARKPEQLYSEALAYRALVCPK